MPRLPEAFSKMREKQHRKEKGYENYGCYFGCDSFGKEGDDSFASSMERMLKDFEWNK